MSARYTRHNELPVLSAWPAKIEADCYNIVRRALTRQGQPPGAIWLDMPELRSLRLILMPDAWVVADGALNDMPVAAWTDFAPAPDRALHEPVISQLRYYHGHAGLIVGKTKAIMRRELRGQLGDGDGDGRVVKLRRPGQA